MKCRDKGANGKALAAYAVRVTGEEARKRIGDEFGEMVGRLIDDGVDFQSIAIVGIVGTPEGWLIKTTGVGSRPELEAVLRQKMRAAVDAAFLDVGLAAAQWSSAPAEEVQ